MQAKEQKYAELVRSTGYEFGRQLADAWCAAFVWIKRPPKKSPSPPSEGGEGRGEVGGFDFPITNEVFRRLERNPHDAPKWMRDEIKRLAGQYQFFHWHLAFADVFQVPPAGQKPENQLCGWNGGFDVILGNPPWERVKLQEKEWFAQRRPDIANVASAAARKRLIESLRIEDPKLFRQFSEALRQTDGESHVLRNTGLYALCGCGDINLYAVFAELMRNHLSPARRGGCVLPSGVATDDTTKFFLQDLVEKKSLVSLFDFENRKGLFPAVDSRMKFCLLTMGSRSLPAGETTEFIFFAHQVEDLRDVERRFTLNAEEIALLNPNTRTCPIFRSKRDVELAKRMRWASPVWKLIADGNEVSPWGVSIRRLVDMNLQAALLKTEQELSSMLTKDEDVNYVGNGETFLRVFEGKMVFLFHHRFADAYTVAVGQRTGRATEVEPSELLNPHRLARCRFWVSEPEVASAIPGWNRKWLFAYMDVCSVTNERTVISAIVPWSATSFSLRVLAETTAGPKEVGCLASNFGSFAFDYYVRQFVGGLHLSDYIMYQMPVLPPETYALPCAWAGQGQTLQAWLLPRVLELTYTAWDLEAFAQDCGWSGPPFRWDEKRRFLLRCELDAAFFHLYGLNRDDTAYILDTFPIVKRKDEARYNGDYRTQRVILEIYDALAAAQRTGQPYATRLDPPPADARCCHPPRQTLNCALISLAH